MTVPVPIDLAQADLFSAPVLPGFALTEDFISPAEEQELIGAIDGAGLTPFKFQQWIGKRLTLSFGWNYDFEAGRFDRAEPIPDWLDALKGRAAQFAGLEPDDLVQALLIQYDPGAGIGWHRDRPVFDHVVGISLGAATKMRFRRRVGPKFERATVPLMARSVYHLSGEARNDWEHSIADMEVPRWSITFRSLRSTTNGS